MRVIDYLNAYYLEPVERLFSDKVPSEGDKRALDEFKWVLEKLDNGLIESLDCSVEWVIKNKLADNALDYEVEEGLSEDVARIALLNQYMAVTDPLYNRLVEENKVKTILSEEAVEKAFYEAPTESRGTLRVELAREFKEEIKTISWSYLKLNPKIRYEPFTFNELDGWTSEKIQELIDEIKSNIKPGYDS